jgi:hypothetical protein
MNVSKHSECLHNPWLIDTQQRPSRHDLAILIHAANHDRLLVEVNADKQHGESPRVEIGKEKTSIPVYHEFRAVAPVGLASFIVSPN